MDEEVKDVKEELNKVSLAIEEVERSIKDVEKQLKTEKDADETKYLREKEKQLRDEKKQLREKEKQLREEKKQLREEKTLLIKQQSKVDQSSAMRTPVRQQLRKLVRSAVKAETRPRAFVSRTASQRFQDRKVTERTDISCFGLTLPDLEGEFKWPDLPTNLPEDLSKEKLKLAQTKAGISFATVQLAATALFPKFVESLGKRATAGYVDTHASAMSNNAKPDQTHPVFGCAATPAFVRFLGDLKKRRTSDTAPSFTTEEKEHAIGFALQWLAMEPARSHFFVYLLDLKWFQLFRVAQKDGSVWESPILDFQQVGQKWLAALLMATDDAVGYPNIRVPKFSGSIASLNKFLGAGATSLVYADENDHAVKIFKDDKTKHITSKEAAAIEVRNLDRLNTRIKELNKCSKDVRKMIPSKGEYELSDCRTALRLPRVGEKPVFSSRHFSLLVDFLHTLHKAKLAHRDLRPANLISYNGSLLPIDFGSLCELGKASPYHGTELYASDSVLDELDKGNGDKVIVTASDDLISLVRCARKLVNVDDDFQVALEQSANTQLFWSIALTGVWQSLMESARKGDYEQLKVGILNLNLNTPRIKESIEVSLSNINLNDDD